MPERTLPAAGLVRTRLGEGRRDEAGSLAARLIGGTFDLPVTAVVFTVDEYSLNSVSGRVRLADNTERFFKFHHEEGEEDHVAEYYRAQLLERAGLPVEVPVAVCTEPGRQMALYEVRTEPRMADVCLRRERDEGSAATLPDELYQARRTLDRRIGEAMTATLTHTGGRHAAQPAVHQLFHHRLVDTDGTYPGGRYRGWYTTDPAWSKLADHTWRVNGIDYPLTLRQLFDRAHRLLDPVALAAEPVVIAHGDDHHGNVWCVPTSSQQPELRLFDPAFAGDDIPALLAAVKATFHNALAHPLWLYQPEEAATRFRIDIRTVGRTVLVETDATLSPLRRRLLDSVGELVWAPLLAELRRRDQLRTDWRQLVRSALFCCPTLVTNLIAPHRPEPVRLLGLAMAVAAGCEPEAATDPLTAMLDGLERTP